MKTLGFYLSKYLYFCFCIRAYLSSLFCFNEKYKENKKFFCNLRFFYLRNLAEIMHTLDNNGIKNLRITQFKRRKAIFLKNKDFFVKVTYNIDSTKNEYIMAKKACDENSFNFSKMYAYLNSDNFEYIVQENIKGDNIRELFRFKNATIEIQMSMLSQLKQIITNLKELKIHHRDMWSKNLLYDKKKNRLCLIDFEIAIYNDPSLENYKSIPIATDKIAIDDLLKKHFSNTNTEIIKLKKEIDLKIQEHIKNA